MSTQDTQKPSSRREHLLAVATDLFAANGYHKTGIDRILKESGVAKMTLYKHFPTKDALIAESIRFRGVRSRAWFVRQVEARADAPEERLLALFDVLEDWFATASFRGCPFVNATAEYGDARDPIHAAAAEHKTLLRDYFLEQATAAGFADAQAVVTQQMLLMEGAIVTRQVSGPDSPSRQAANAMRVLLNLAARQTDGANR